MNNVFYVIYDDNSNVLEISREFNEGDNYFVIEPKKVIDFLLGRKSVQGYYVKKNHLGVYSLEPKQDNFQKELYNDMCDIFDSSEHDELTVIHDSRNTQWIFSISDDLKDTIDIVHYSKILQFYICLNNQHNFLIRTMSFKVEDLIHTPVKIPFDTKFEYDFGTLKLVSKKYFNRVGIKNV